MIYELFMFYIYFIVARIFLFSFFIYYCWKNSVLNIDVRLGYRWWKLSRINDGSW